VMHLGFVASLDRNSSCGTVAEKICHLWITCRCKTSVFLRAVFASNGAKYLSSRFFGRFGYDRKHNG
jgi:hypothetical protein